MLERKTKNYRNNLRKRKTAILRKKRLWSRRDKQNTGGRGRENGRKGRSQG